MTRHRGFAVFMFVLVSVLIIVTVIVSAATFFKGRSDANSARLTPQQQFAVRNGDKVVVGFDAESLSVAEGQLKGNLSFTLPEGVRSQLVETDNRKPVFQCGSDGTCSSTLLRQAHAKLQVYVGTFDANGRPTYETLRSFTMQDLANSFLTDRVSFPVTLPISAFQSNYPDDTYKAGITLDYGFPGTMALKNGASQLPVDYEVDGGSVAKNFDVSVRHNTELPTIKDQNFLISFKRGITTRLYIYIVALVPLVLAIIFLHLLFFSKHAHSREFEEYPEALIVTILAVLPLRIVLVPPEITELTRADLLLGFGLVVIVAIAGWKYATEVWAAGAPSKFAPLPAEPHHETQPAMAGSE